MKTEIFETRIERIAFALVLLGIFFIPFSPSIDNAISVGALLSLCAGQYRARLAVWQQHRTIIYLSLGLCALFLLSVFGHDVAPLHVGLHGFKKYAHKLIGFIVLIPLFVNAQRRHLAYHTLIVSTLIAAVVFACHTLQLINLEVLFHKPADHVIAPLQLSCLLAFTCYLLLQFSLQPGRGRKLYIAALLLTLIYQFYINQERTGMLATLAVLGLFAWQHLSKKTFCLSMACAPLLCAALYLSSPTLQARVHRVQTELAHLHDADYKFASVVVRLNFIKYSLRLAQAKPWLGYGTGSFPYAYKNIGGPGLFNDVALVGDPHNSYLNILVQFGVCGLLLYLCWLAVQWLHFSKQLSAEGKRGQALWLSFAIACCFIDAMLLNQTSTFYLTFLALVYGAHTKALPPIVQASLSQDQGVP